MQRSTLYLIVMWLVVPAVVVAVLPTLLRWTSVGPADYVAMYFVGLFATGLNLGMWWLLGRSTDGGDQSGS